MTSLPVMLVVGADRSRASLRARELLCGYRGDPSRLRVLLANVQARPLSMWPGASIDPSALDAALVDAGRAELAPALAELSAAGIDAQAAVCLGMAAPALLAEAQVHRAQAILLGTRGRGLLHGFSIGSVAMRVAHAGALPVFIVGPESRLPAQLGVSLRVLCAVDGSAPSVRAVERLLAWRDWLGELEIHLVHVREPLTLAETLLPPHGDVLEHWSGVEAEEATREVRELLTAAGVRHVQHAVAGDPAAEIVRIADEIAGEMVVLGTRGRGIAHHALVGSVALRVAASSPVPVLLVS